MKKLTVVLIIFCVFAYLAERKQSIHIKYKVTQLQNQYDKLLTERDNLLFKINSILSRENMHALAAQKNLSIPDEKSIIIIE